MFMLVFPCISTFFLDILEILVTSTFVVLTRTEVNDFEFIICSLVCFQHDVLWLKISMNDIMFMAIVDGRENMFHYLNCIFLW